MPGTQAYLDSLKVNMEHAQVELWKLKDTGR